MGPWAVEACHAGPPTAALARAFEQFCLQHHIDKQLLRMTVNLLRPVPMSGFRIEVSAEKLGRSSAYLAAKLFDRDNKVCALATSLHQIELQLGETPTIAAAAPNPLAIEDFEQHGEQSRYYQRGQTLFPSKQGFVRAVNTLSASLEETYHGDNPKRAVWMRTPQLIEEESLSAFQSICPLADCANGFAANGSIEDFQFMNTDLTISMHRKPRGAWLASSAQSFWQSTGYGASYATLYDRDGAIGMAMQSLLIKKHE